MSSKCIYKLRAPDQNGVSWLYYNMLEIYHFGPDPLKWSSPVIIYIAINIIIVIIIIIITIIVKVAQAPAEGPPKKESRAATAMKDLEAEIQNLSADGSDPSEDDLQRFDQLATIALTSMEDVQVGADQ